MTAAPARPAGDWRGVDLGSRTVDYAERDAILYALAVGASAGDLDLVFEERLRVLPTFALTLAQWAPDALGGLGAFDTRTAVHGAQRLLVLGQLPRSGSVTMRARVAEVWDKGSAAVFEVAVESDFFVATWSLFAPGCGCFGGRRGPSKPEAPRAGPEHRLVLSTAPNQAALYRLLGDRHHMHIDPAAAVAAGKPRPFLHGLCTLAAATLAVAQNYDAHPADLRSLAGRFAAPVYPGDQLSMACWGTDADAVTFTAEVGEHTVLTGGEAKFS
ncbi:MaoC/PaaZ C-terminal domain-containing protein [Saccharopolyspora sp. NPDC000359]|uniref:MaoC/PaaZ C-terminal domain-containing protein n=1 Tax=Saccharopolyspora sp. NPDC000359 TaxID=3154251 RepID=UPI0033171087